MAYVLKPRWLVCGLVMLAVAGTLPQAQAGAPGPWPLWEQFNQRFQSPDGRIIDRGSARQHTVSEGQAYALFFALVANDQGRFNQLYRWTENNLGQGDLSAHLPAWHWGRNDRGEWTVLDPNPASDADLWLAYSLLEAGRLWCDRRWLAMGRLLAQRVLASEVQAIPGLGQALLPGPTGFQPAPGLWRLNPSYLPLFQLRRMARLFADEPRWQQLAQDSLTVLLQSAPHGFTPEWTLFREGQGFTDDLDTPNGLVAEGSYNAVRVYLWLGLMSDQDPAYAVLNRHHAPMAQWIERNGHVPERISTRHPGDRATPGPVGFDAALLPWLQRRQSAATARLQARWAHQRHGAQAGYYDHVLMLFADGGLSGRYRIEADGRLVPAWSVACNGAGP